MSDANGGEERSAVTESAQTSSRLSGLSRRSGTSAPQSLLDIRQAIERQSLGEVAAGVAVRGQSYGGVWCLECTPAEVRSTTLYLHGGGFRMCSPEIYAPFASRLAQRCHTRVIVPRYGLAPEQPFPAALLDAVEAYLEVARRYGPLVVGGDSAGGGLAVAMTLAMGVNVDTPIGLVLLSPWVDLSLSGESYRSRKERDQRFSLSAAREAADSYLGGFAASDPLVSPIFGDLNDLPSSVVLVGTEEVLFDDSRRLVDGITQSKGSADLHIFPGMQHVWPVAEPELPESHRAMEIVAEFFPTAPRRVLGAPTRRRCMKTGDPFRVEGRVAVVTGAASGIGASVAAVLAAAGADVVLADRDSKGLAGTAENIAEFDRQAVSSIVDVRSRDEVEELGRLVEAHFGRLDIWVNVAGILAKIGDRRHVAERSG